MGAGKSTLGKILSRDLGWPYFDNDDEITSNYGLTAAEVALLPVPELHELESRYLFDVLQREESFVAGAAASVIESEENRILISAAVGVYLRLPLEEIIERAGTSGVGRQALKSGGNQLLIDRFNRRDPLYRSIAKLTVELSNSPKNDAQTIKDVLLA